MHNPSEVSSKNLFYIIVVAICTFHGLSYSQNESKGNDEKTDGEKPLWEIGLFNGAIYLPDYRGSGESSFFALPLPYIMYRGKRLQTQKDRINSTFFRSERFETNISLFVNPPVDDDNDAREGMQELDPIFEIGPVFKWYFAGRNPKRTLYLNTTVRSALSVGIDDLDFASQGFRGILGLVYKKHALFGNDKWRFGFNTGVDFIDQEYSGYFYDVSPQFIRPDRELFDSDGGYAGFMLSWNLVRKGHRKDRFRPILSMG